MWHHKDKQVGPARGLGKIGHGYHIFRQRYIGKVLDVFVALVDNVGQLCSGAVGLVRDDLLVDPHVHLVFTEWERCTVVTDNLGDGTAPISTSNDAHFSLVIICSFCVHRGVKLPQAPSFPCQGQLAAGNVSAKGSVCD